jgi:hypothetical protein
MLLLLSAAMFKLGIYVFWKINKRLEKLELKTKAIKKAIINLHKEEFRDIQDALHRININLLDHEKKAIGLDIIDEEALKIQEELWLKDDTKE